MPEMMLMNGSWKEVSWDEVRERSGEEAVRALTEPSIPRSEMSEDERHFTDRMQDEAQTSAGMAAAGTTIHHENVPQKYKAYMLTLLSALDKLPDYPVTRAKRETSLSREEIVRYIPGQIVTEETFTSACTARGFRGNVRFLIDPRHAKHTEWISAHPVEGEMMFKAGTRFHVRNRYREDEFVHIELEEVDDD